MPTKKIVLISLGVIVLIVLGLFFYTSNKFQSLNDRFVNLKPGTEQRIVLVNLGDGDRKYIAQKIREVANCNSSILSIDFMFNDYSEDSGKDSMLLESIASSKCILATKHAGLGTHGVHQQFLKAALDYGYAELNQTEAYATDFYLFRDAGNKRDFHFAYTIANRYDSTAAKVFISTLPDSNPNIVISRLTNQFRFFDFEEAIDCETVKDKIVIMGYLGPTDEDKFTTYAKYHDQSDGDGPDMYGPVIVANQVLMMIGE